MSKNIHLRLVREGSLVIFSFSFLSFSRSREMKLNFGKVSFRLYSKTYFVLNTVEDISILHDESFSPYMTDIVRERFSCNKMSFTLFYFYKNKECLIVSANISYKTSGSNFFLIL